MKTFRVDCRISCKNMIKNYQFQIANQKERKKKYVNY